MIRNLRLREAGFTLLELMVVITIAGMLALGLVAFYLTCQASWMDASTQALAQRDATSIMEAMREQTETASNAGVYLAGGGKNSLLILYDHSGDEIGRFFWSPADSLIHYAVGSSPADDRGPLAPTKVERFSLHADLDPNMSFVWVDTLRVHSTTGQQVQMSGGMGMYNGQ